MSLKDQYITDITNGCNYIDEQVAAKTTEKTPFGTWKLQEAIDGVKFQLDWDEVKNSGEDLSAFNTSVTNAEEYLKTL